MSFGLFVFCAVLIAAVLLFSVGAVIAGKTKLRRALRPVEYYPPRGYSPIDVLLKVYAKTANPHALFNPLMLYWAECGFITIEEDCKRGLKITKLKPISPSKHERPDFDCKMNYRAEKTLFDEIFSNGPVFYTLAAETAYEKVYEKFMKTCKANAKAVNTKKSKAIELAMSISSVAVLVLITIIGAIIEHNALYMAMVFPIVACIAMRFVPDEMFLKYPFFAVWGGAPFAAVLAFADRGCAILLGCAFAVAVLSGYVLARFVDFRTDADVEIYGQICAFKTFLLDAEIDRLETLVEENPDYFYDILPYCYVLKITDKLKPKFDKISLDGPSWYLGNMRDTLMF